MGIIDLNMIVIIDNKEIILELGDNVMFIIVVKEV